MNNANIERISFEEIQEFKNLDLYLIDPSLNPYQTVLLAYDPSTRKFGTAILDTDPSSGGVIVQNDAKLLRDVIVSTDKLSIAPGYIFKKDLEFTEFVEELCNPRILPVLSLTVSPNLVEVAVNVQIQLSFDYLKNGYGEKDLATLLYFKNNVSLGNSLPSEDYADIITPTTENQITYKVNVNSLDVENASGEVLVPAVLTTDSEYLRVAYPNMNGESETQALPDLVSDGSKTALTDIKRTHNVILDLSGNFKYHWFATHISNIPTAWTEIDANGVEDAWNNGPIDSLFEKVGIASYNGNSFDIYFTQTKTTFSNRIKIKF